jgi:hypothetical protein
MNEYSFGPGTLTDATGRVLGYTAPSSPDVSAPITFPAPTADWGTVVGFSVFGVYQRSTDIEIRRCRYVRQYRRRRLRLLGIDPGRIGC